MAPSHRDLRYARQGAPRQGINQAAASQGWKPKVHHIGHHAASRGAKLHIGCGVKRLHGWINADGVPGVGDVVMDLQSDFPALAYSEIYGSHVLEHCWSEDTPGILARLFNALQPGGTLRLSVPDIRLTVKNCIDGHAYGDERSALAVIYGGTFSKNTASPDLHRQTFWKERLTRLLNEAGFVNIREWGRGQYPAIDALKDFATFPFDPVTGKSLISLNMEADRPGTLPKPEKARVDVSIILGTVDRGEMLHNCVKAVRNSLEGSGLTHEIVIAYGRANESNLPWMKQQRDILPVFGGMNGAIDAFNKAYAASHGKYICQINDDVLVDGVSIARAISYLEQHKTSAGVVFKFDQGDGKGYRHEMFVNALHPNQMVVRRETCEVVIEDIGAFWGDEKHRTDNTYGGDTLFGVICKHRGLRLDSVDGVTCKDLLAPDQLRAVNKAAVAPDHGKNFSALIAPYMSVATPGNLDWPHCYVPRTGRPPRRSPIEAGRPLRVLSLPIVVKDWPQTALRTALARIGPLIEVVHDGSMGNASDVFAAVRASQPDLVFAQIQQDGWRDFVHALRAAAGPACTLVTWNGDVRTDGSQSVLPWISALAASVDISLFDNCSYPRKLATKGLRAGYLSAGFESEIVWEPNAIEDRGGAVFFGTNYLNLDGGERQNMFASLVRAIPGSLMLYGSGWQTPNSHPNVEVGYAAQIMRRTPVTISTSLYQNIDRYTSNRLKNAFAAGAVTAVRAFPDMAGLGIEPGKNCLSWSTVDDLIALVSDWIRPSRANERKIMRERARNLAVERFSWNRGIEELLAIVRDYRARKGHP